MRRKTPMLLLSLAIWLLSSTVSAQIVKASYDVFGTGCKGTAGVPRLFAEPPKIDSEFLIALTNLPKLEIGFVAFGVSELKPPTDLANIGMPGCLLFVRPLVCVPIGTGFGRAVLPISIPNDSTLLGKVFFNQAAIRDKPTNAMGLIMSNAGKGTVGTKNQR